MTLMRQLPSIDTQIVNSLVPVIFDAVYQNNPDAVTEVYTFKSAGTTVATVTVVYTDSTKATLSSVVRT